MDLYISFLIVQYIQEILKEQTLCELRRLFAVCSDCGDSISCEEEMFVVDDLTYHVDCYDYWDRHVQLTQ